MKKALITGVTGQDGSYLAELLLKKGYEVHGMIRRSSSLNTFRIDHLCENPKIYNKKFFLHFGDLSDGSNINRIIEQIQPDEIYHLGAQSVAEECLCPILSAKKMDYRTLGDLWNEQVKKNKKIRIENIDGVKIEVIDLPNNTQLKALGMWNGMGTWFSIKQISRHRWKGKMAKLSQKFGSIMVTPNHSILDVNGKICVPKENPWLLNVRKLNYKPNRYKSNIHLKLDGVYKSSKSYFWLDEKGILGKVLKIITENKIKPFCRFIGAFIAEGHTTFNKANGNWYVGISSSDKKWLKELEVDLKTFYDGKCWYIKHKKGKFKDVWELQIKSRALYNLVRKLLGHDSKTKQLPHWFSQIKNEYLSEIWKKMLEGDGCINKKNGFRYTTASYKLACQLSWLFTTLGYDYTICEEVNGSATFWHFRECTMYQAHQGSLDKKLKWINYNGWVYDITVDEVSNFTVGVGNIVVHNSHVRVSFDLPEYTGDVTGLGTTRILDAIRKNNLKTKFYQASSSEMFGKTKETPQKETTPFHPRSPYACAKVYAYWITRNYREAYNMFTCNGILFNHESITAQTPIIIKKHNLIDIIPVEEVVPHREDPRHGIKYSTTVSSDLEIWDGNKWTKVKTLTAAWNKAGSSEDKEVKRIVCRGGYYEATKDHISFLENDKEIKTGNLKAGDRLTLKTFPRLETDTVVGLEEAEFLGMMVADGYISNDGRGRFINNNRNLRKKAAELWQKISGGYSREDVHPSGFDKNKKVYSIEFAGNSQYLRLIWNEIYTQKLFKRVPRRILNAKKEIVMPFLKGYNNCDGLKGGHQKTEFKSFTTNSPTLALGLWYLISRSLGLRITLHPEFRKDYLYFHLNINSDNKTRKGKHLQKELSEIKTVKNYDYSGWLFDLETESKTFSAGVGLTWIHNSPRRGETFVTKKITRGLVRIKLGKEKKLFLGNLDAKRDWGYAKDYVEGMWLMTQQKEPDDYILATNETHSVREFAEKTAKWLDIDLIWQGKGIKEKGIDKKTNKTIIEIDPIFFRPAEVEVLRGDYSKAKKKLGWKPKVKFNELVEIMVKADYDDESRRSSKL